jgi:hypothetical protein
MLEALGSIPASPPTNYPFFLVVLFFLFGCLFLMEQTAFNGRGEGACQFLLLGRGLQIPNGSCPSKAVLGLEFRVSLNYTIGATPPDLFTLVCL